MYINSKLQQCLYVKFYQSYEDLWTGSTRQGGWVGPWSTPAGSSTGDAWNCDQAAPHGNFLGFFLVSDIACDFEDKFACGYIIEEDPFQWQLHSALDVTDGIGPKTDHKNSVLGICTFERLSSTLFTLSCTGRNGLNWYKFWMISLFHGNYFPIDSVWLYDDI